jgi:hypothetical protein
MCITQVKLATLMKKKKKLYLHMIPHFQRIQMCHTILENLVNNLFQFEVIHEDNVSWDCAWLQIFGKPDYWYWQVLKHSMQLFPPTIVHHPLFTWQRHQSMDEVMGKHGRMYAPTTFSMRGGRRWQTSSTIGVMKSY